MKGKWVMFVVATLAACMLGTGNLSAGAGEDWGWVYNELQKPVEQQNAALIDQKLANVVANPDKITSDTYRGARWYVAQRRINAMPAADAPEKRRLLNEEYVRIISDITRLYLGADRTGYADRLYAYGVQVGAASWITESSAQAAAEAQIADSLMKEVNTRYLPSKELTAQQKEWILRAAIGSAGALRDRTLGVKLSLELYAQVLALGTPTSKEAYVGQALVKLGAGQTDEALADLAKLIADPAAADDVKNLARSRRMEILANAQRWTDAEADAAALAAAPFEQAKGPFFTPNTAAQAKILALKVNAATGKLDRETCADKSAAFLVETLAAKNLSAEEKSTYLTVVLLDMSRDAAGAYQWLPALALARGAFNVAPNYHVSAAVTLVQQILAHRSQNPVCWKSFSVVPAAEDLARAQAFYARQSGEMKKDDKVVVLAPDLSNLDQFPAQLDITSVPFKEEVTAAVAKIAAEHPDPMTRALAYALLFESDKALDVMMGAVNSLPLDSPRLSEVVNFTARFVRAKFESVALANAFLRSQVRGPAGEDGKKGTADDTPNPLEAASR